MNDASIKNDSMGEDVSRANGPKQDRDPVNWGMPKLVLGDKPVSFFEFWPAWFFYLPIVFYWVYLSIKYRNFGLPMVVNPNIELGGMVGESKRAILESMNVGAKHHWLRYIHTKKDILPTNALWQQWVKGVEDSASAESIVYPFVIKPDLGCRGSGVSLINNFVQLETYLQAFPLGREFMVQTLAPFDAEAGVFYERMPGDSKGRITSITLKYRPYVQGDGVNTLSSLILNDSRARFLAQLYKEKNKSRLDWVPNAGEYVSLAFAGSHCRGSIFRNGNDLITQEMEAAFDGIAQSMPDFHYGRFDIKFKDIALLQEGKAFFVIELNGASSEKTHIWDSRESLKTAFSTLLEQYRVLFLMGEKMLKRGHKTPSAFTMIKVWLQELKKTKEYPDSVTEI